MIRPKRTTLSKKNMIYRGVSRDMLETTIEDFETFENKGLEQVKNFVREYLENIQDKYKDNIGLLLYGSNGVGKSFIANMITKEAYINRFSSKRVTFSNYIQEYTRVWDAKTTAERESLEDNFYYDFKDVSFLVLEEVGKELDNSLAPTVLEDCLRHREENGLPTIICTNLSLPKLQDRYGASIVSLIKGNMLDIRIEGVDRRAEIFRERL